jgi:WD40 repeat protein
MGDLIVLDGQGKEVARFNDSPQTDVVSAISVSDDGNVFTYSLYEKYPKLRYITIDTRKKTNCEEIFNPSGSVSKSGYGGGEQIKSIAISSDGKYVISSYGEGSHGTLCLFPYFGWKKLWKKESGEIRDIAISTNGSSVYAGLGNGDIVGYSQSGNLSFNYSSGSPITSLSVASDKNLLAAGNADGNLYLFDHTGDLLWTTNIEEFPVGEITQVEISRNGASLVALVNNKHLYFYTQEPGTSQDESLKFTGTFTPVSTNTPVSTFTPVSESTPGKIGISTALLVLSLLAAIVLVRRK